MDTSVTRPDTEEYSRVPQPGLKMFNCEKCDSAFYSKEYYDLCPDCVDPYEQALHDQQQEELKEYGEIRSLRV